jgi:hypothetical protein
MGKFVRSFNSRKSSSVRLVAKAHHSLNTRSVDNRSHSPSHSTDDVIEVDAEDPIESDTGSLDDQADPEKQLSSFFGIYSNYRG